MQTFKQFLGEDAQQERSDALRAEYRHSVKTADAHSAESNALSRSILNGKSASTHGEAAKSHHSAAHAHVKAADHAKRFSSDAEDYHHDQMNHHFAMHNFHSLAQNDKDHGVADKDMRTVGDLKKRLDGTDGMGKHLGNRR